MPTSTTEVPHNYVAPHWPSLYWPVRATPGTPAYLYYTTDIWRFTLYWTLLMYGAVHVFAAAWAVLMQLRSAFTLRHKDYAASTSVKQTLGWVWIVPVIYCVVGGIEALLAGSVVGLVLGAVYSAGNYKMSTWMPFLWGQICVLVIILGSFSIQGGL